MASKKKASVSEAAYAATPEAKKRAGTFRLIAILSWVLALAAEAAAILLLLSQTRTYMPVFMQDNLMLWVIVAIAVDLVFAILGILLWKKANRFDPASEKEQVRFFIQNQLGVFIAVLCFLPLVIIIFTNKDLDKKQKGILGAVAIGALIVAGILGIDFDPASIEKYAAETARVKELTGVDQVYWTVSGGSYHLYRDCQYIRDRDLGEGAPGTIQEAKESKNSVKDLCDVCEKRALKDDAMIAAAQAARAASE